MPGGGRVRGLKVIDDADADADAGADAVVVVAAVVVVVVVVYVVVEKRREEKRREEKGKGREGKGREGKSKSNSKSKSKKLRQSHPETTQEEERRAHHHPVWGQHPSTRSSCKGTAASRVRSVSGLKDPGPSLGKADNGVKVPRARPRKPAFKRIDRCTASMTELWAFPIFVVAVR